MASSNEISRDHWQVHLSARDKSEVKVEVHMSREMAEKISALETDLGSAVLRVLLGSASG